MSDTTAGRTPRSVPEEVWREMEAEVAEAGGPYEPTDWGDGAVGRTMVEGQTGGW